MNFWFGMDGVIRNRPPNKCRRTMIHCPRTSTISIAIMLLCTFSFSLCANPNLYICKHVHFLPDSSYSQSKNRMVVDSITSYLAQMFSIDTSSIVDENILLQHHLEYNKSQKTPLPKTSHCSAKYFLCITAKMTTEFRTEDKRFVIPVPISGGGISVNNITIKDDQPEYHFLTELAFAFYRTSDGKRILYWLDQDDSQNDSANCSDCIPKTISEISGNIHRHLHSQNPIAVYMGANIGVLTLLDWYNPSYSEDISFGSSFGISGKLLFRKIFGIDVSFSHHSISSGKYTSNELSLGPCFGFKIYTTNPLCKFIYPNGSIGVTYFWNTRNTLDEIDTVKSALPVIGALSGRISMLLCLKRFPLSLEPNLKMIIRPTSNDGIVGLDLGLRIGITQDFNRIR